MNKLLLLLCLCLVSCASKTGVLQLSPNTYTLSSGAAGTGSVSGNNTMSKRDAITDANAFCASKGKEIVIQNISLNSTYAGSTTELIFKCFDANDPNLKDPKYRKEPNIIIENR